MLHQAQASKSIYGLELGPVYDPALILIVFEHQAPATANGTGRAGVILYLGPIAVVLGLQLVPVCGGAFGPVVRGETTGLIEYGYHHGCTETAVGIRNGILCGKLGDLTPHLVKDLTALVPLGTGRSDGHGLHTLASQHRPSPPRPSAWYFSSMAAAKATLVSPAGPMTRVEERRSRSSRMLSSAVKTSWPHKLSAALICAPAESTSTRTGLAAAPVITRASHSVSHNVRAMVPPE